MFRNQRLVISIAQPHFLLLSYITYSSDLVWMGRYYIGYMGDKFSDPEKTALTFAHIDHRGKWHRNVTRKIIYSFIDSCIHSFNTYILRTYYMPGQRTRNPIRILPPWSLHPSGVDRHQTSVFVAVSEEKEMEWEAWGWWQPYTGGQRRHHE